MFWTLSILAVAKGFYPLSNMRPCQSPTLGGSVRKGLSKRTSTSRPLIGCPAPSSTGSYCHTSSSLTLNVPFSDKPPPSHPMESSTCPHLIIFPLLLGVFLHSPYPSSCDVFFLSPPCKHWPSTGSSQSPLIIPRALCCLQGVWAQEGRGLNSRGPHLGLG